MELTKQQQIAGKLWQLAEGLQMYAEEIAARSQGALSQAGIEDVGRTCFECAREYETPDLWANELPYDWRPFDDYEAASKSFLSDYSHETTH